MREEYHFWPCPFEALGWGEKVKYQKIQLWAHFKVTFHETVYAIIIGGRMKCITILFFFVDFTPGSCLGVGTLGHKGQNRFFFFKLKIWLGVIPGEIVIIFQLCLRWEVWGFAMACHRLHSHFLNLFFHLHFFYSFSFCRRGGSQPCATNGLAGSAC